MANIAVIPARKGSKGLPGKNMAKLWGKPLYWWSLLYTYQHRASAGGLLDKCIITSDWDELLDDASKRMKGIILFKREHPTPDDGRDYEKIQELHKYGMVKREDVIFWLRPTSPWRPLDLLPKMLRTPEVKLLSSMRCVREAQENPWKSWFFDFGGEGDDPLIVPLAVSRVGPDGLTDIPADLPRQYLPKPYWQTGMLDILRASSAIDGDWAGPWPGGYKVDIPGVLDIDSKYDLYQMEHSIPPGWAGDGGAKIARGMADVYKPEREQMF